MLGAAHSWSRFCEFEKQGPTILGGSLVRYNLYETSDHKWMTLGALEEKFWKKFCDVIGKPEWGSFSFKEENDIRSELEKIFKEKTQQEWTLIGEKSDVCLFPVEENLKLSQPSKKTPQVGQHNQKILKSLGVKK
ncbi:MAG: CoA transferase [Deltaproteobacteria bacterium]|nr:MAG: CoA transferase [Deltaproteobacteria bacterium]